MEKTRKGFEQQFKGAFQMFSPSTEYFYFDQFARYLDFLSQKTFDRKIAEFFFDKMEKTQDNCSNIYEFIRVYFLAEMTLTQKIQDALSIQTALKDERDELENKYNESLFTEQQSKKSKKIKQQQQHNFLTIELLDLYVIDNQEFNLKVDNRGKYFLVIDFEGNQEQSKTFNFGDLKIVEGQQSQILPLHLINDAKKQAYLQQIFSLTVSRIDQNINIYLMDGQVNSPYLFDVQNAEGNIYLPLKQYSNQKKQLVSTFLYNKKGEQLNIFLKCNVQFIYSKAQYYSDALDSWNKEVSAQDQSIMQIQQDLKEIYSLVQNLNLILDSQPQQDINNNNEFFQILNQNQMNESRFNLADNRFSINQSEQSQRFIRQSQNQNSSNLDINLSRFSTNKQQQQQQQPYQDEEKVLKQIYISKNLGIAITLLSCIINWERQGMQDMSIVLFFIFIMFRKNENPTKQQLQAVFIGLILTIFYDLFWIFIVPINGFSDFMYIDNSLVQNKTLHFYRTLVYICIFINVILKSILIYFVNELQEIGQ